MPEDFGFVAEDISADTDFGFTPEPIIDPFKEIKLDEFDFEQGLKTEKDRKESEMRIAFLKDRAAKAQANDPRNWTYEQTKEYFKKTPPKSPQEEAQVNHFLEQKKQTLEDDKSQIQKMEAAESLMRWIEPGIYEDAGISKPPTDRQRAFMDAAKKKDIWERLPASTKFDIISEKVAGKAAPYLVTLPAAGIFWPWFAGYEALQQTKNVAVPLARGEGMQAYSPLEDRTLTELVQPILEKVPEAGPELPEMPGWMKFNATGALAYKTAQWALKNPRQAVVVGATVGETILDYLIVKRGLQGSQELLRSFSDPAKADLRKMGLSVNATTKEIEERYRQMVLKIHPDRPEGNTEAFQDLNNTMERIRESRRGAAQKVMDYFREMKPAAKAQAGDIANAPIVSTTGQAVVKGVDPMAGGMVAGAGREIPPQITKWLDKGITVTERQAPIRITDPEAKIKDINGKIVDLPKGHEMTPYKLSNGNIWLHDGKDVIVNSGQLQNLANKNLVLGEKPVSPDEAQIEEVVKGGGLKELPAFSKVPGYSGVGEGEATNLGSFSIDIKKVGNKYLGNVYSPYENDAVLSVTGNTKEDVKAELLAAINSNEKLMKDANINKTKFSQYQLPGGENYREVLFTAPQVTGEAKNIYSVKTISPHEFIVEDTSGKEYGFVYKNKQEAQVSADFMNQEKVDFRSPHWNEPNVISHARINDRITPEGKKILFIEEIQSDWAREARKIPERELAQGFNPSVKVPSSHPLLKNWQEFTLKRILKKAVAEGYDGIAWTTGEQQAERYDLSKQVKEITVSKGEYPNKWYVNGVSSEGKVFEARDIKDDKALENTIGKDLSAKAIKKLENKDLNTRAKFEGVDLKIGGEWAKNLYDKQIPNTLKDLTKGEVSLVNLGQSVEKGAGGLRGPELDIKKLSQPYLSITPQMRERLIGVPKAGGLVHRDEGIIRPTPELIKEAEALRPLAIEKQKQLDEVIAQVVAETGAHSVTPEASAEDRAKSVKSTALKVARRHAAGETGYTVRDISDHVREAILVDDLMKFPDVLKSLTSKGSWEFESKLTQPHDSGFRGMFLKTKLGDGINGEIQLGNDAFWKLKKESDIAYRDFRDKDVSQFTKEERSAFFALRDTWSDRWQKFWMDQTNGSLSSFEDFMSRSASGVGITVASKTSAPVMDAETKSRNLGEKTLSDSLSIKSPDSVSAKDISEPPTLGVPQEEEIVKHNVESKFDALSLQQQAQIELDLDDLRITPEGNLFVAIKKLGGIRQYKKGFMREEILDIPKELRPKGAKHAADTIVEELKIYGWNFEDLNDLLSAIKAQVENPIAKVNRTNLRQIIKEAEKNEKLKKKIEDSFKTRRKFIQTVKDSEKTAPEVAKKVESLYDPITNKETLAAAQDYVANDINAAINLIEGAGQPDAFSNTVAIVLIDKAQAEGRFADAIRYVEITAEKQTELGQAIQALSMYNRLTPEGILQAAHKAIRKARENITQKEKLTNFEKLAKMLKTEKEKEVLAKKMGIPHLTEEMAKILRGHAEKIQGMPEGRDKAIETALLLKEITDLIPRSLGQKISMIQTMAQLLNPKTMIRNILGNVGFQVAENIADTFGVALDVATSLITGKRTVHLPRPIVQVKGLAQGMKEGTEEALLGISLKASQSKFSLPRNGVFDTGVLGALEKTLRITLSATDRAFYQAAFNQSLRDQTQFAGVDEPTPEMIERAHQLGLYRTFQDDNAVSNFFVSFKKLLNFKKPFGLGDIVIKYPKTPANILARGIEYSPFNFLRTAWKLAEPLFGREFNQDDFVRSAARSLTGSVLLVGTGALLAAVGVITGKRSKDRDVNAIREASGVLNYQINIDALKRFVASGYDPGAAKLREDDLLATYDWLLPGSIGMALGANLVISPKESVVDKVLNLGDRILVASETLQEQPLVQGMRTLTSKQNIGEGLSSVVKGLPASFVPTLLNQVRQIADNTARNTRDPNYFKEAYNKAIMRVPGLSGQLPARVTVLGEEKQMYQLGSNNPFNVFLNPAFVTRYKPDPVSKMVLDIWESTGETIQFPRVVKASLKIGTDPQFELTADQYTEYQKYVGNKTNILFTILSENKKFIKLDDEVKARMLQKYLTNINTAAKIEIFGYRPKRSVPEDVITIIKRIGVAKRHIDQNFVEEDTGFVEEDTGFVPE